MAAERVTDVWNRACDVIASEDSGSAHDGNRALVAALVLDGAVQSGGLASAVEQGLTGPGVKALRWFGLDDIADVVARGERRVAEATVTGDLAALEEVEFTDDPEYYSLDVEQRLTQALASRLEAAPEAFAPVA